MSTFLYVIFQSMVNHLSSVALHILCIFIRASPFNLDHALPMFCLLTCMCIAHVLPVYYPVLPLPIAHICWQLCLARILPLPCPCFVHIYTSPMSIDHVLPVSYPCLARVLALPLPCLLAIIQGACRRNCSLIAHFVRRAYTGPVLLMASIPLCKSHNVVTAICIHLMHILRAVCRRHYCWWYMYKIPRWMSRS